MSNGKNFKTLNLSVLGLTTASMDRKGQLEVAPVATTQQELSTPLPQVQQAVPTF